MKQERGFSLLELLMVVVIVGIIASIAVPGLRRARQNANAGSAIQSLRTITTAQHLYEKKYKKYAILLDLVPEGTIDNHLGRGEKSGYVFNLALVFEPAPKDPNNPKTVGFTCTATPMDDPTEIDHFFVDETGVIRFKRGAAADVTSDPIPR